MNVASFAGMRATGNRDGFDVAWIAILTLGAFLVLIVVVLGIDASLMIWGNENSGSKVLSAFVEENGQTVMVATVGAIATVAGGALGYQMGLAQPPPGEGEGEL